MIHRVLNLLLTYSFGETSVITVRSCKMAFKIGLTKVRVSTFS